VAPKSVTRDVPLMLSFQAMANIDRNTTKELRSIITQYAASRKVAQLHPAPCNS
jgi:hypothetical protein